MATTSWRNALQKVKNKPRDELYTQRKSIDEMFSYFPAGLFKGKTVLCPCDGPQSKFVEFFKDKWQALGLKRLTCVCYTPSHGMILHMTAPDEEVWHDLFGHGDFRDEETLKYWQEADYVITNPPFSLSHDFVKKCYALDKQFCIVSHMMVSLYAGVFPKIYSGEVKVLLAKNNMYFDTSSGEKFELGNGCWLSNMPTLYRPPVYKHKHTKAENEAAGYVYQKYDNYDALEISALKYLPTDYDGPCGVPITFLNWDFSEYKILGSSTGRYEYDIYPTKQYGNMNFYTHDKKGNKIMKIRGGQNSDALLPVPADFEGNYYMEDNSDQKLVSIFRRIFVQKK